MVQSLSRGGDMGAQGVDAQSAPLPILVTHEILRTKFL